MEETISKQQARLLAVWAQGFGGHAITAPIDMLNLLGAIQLDSVNIVTRNHELVVFSRLGPYLVDSLYQAIYQERHGFEYWGHSASWLPSAEFRYFTHRMKAMTEYGRGASTVNASVREEHADLYAIVLQRIGEEGPLGAADFEDPRGERGFWWDWKPAKLVLEDLFDQGVLMCAGRGKGFERIYDLSERVLSREVDRQEPTLLEAARHLMKRAITAMGVATAREAADYFRCYRWPDPWKEALGDLVAAGEVVELKVEGVRGKAYADPKLLAQMPLTFRHRPSFLAPLDNLMWDRKRVKWLFDFSYKLEFYVPKHKREYGYFVMPLLAESGLRGRADFKFERKANELVVLGAWIDAGYVPDAVIAMCDLGQHLGASTIRVEACQADVSVEELQVLVTARQQAIAKEEANRDGANDK